jgi:hypothetical protein
MYASERIFVKKFLAALAFKGHNDIPFDTPPFYDGIEKMRECFQQIKYDMGVYADELSLLFIRNPIDGSFDEFKNGVSDQNGRLLTFQNPEYISAKINTNTRGAEYILNSGDIGVSREAFISFADCFLKGANIAN